MADARALVPLAVAAPLFAVELWFDARSRGRRLVPALCGAVGISAVVAVIVLLDDQSASLAADAVDRQLRGESVDWQAQFDEPLRYGVETFRAFVKAWYDGSLQDIIFHVQQEPAIRRHICAVLAGYAWDRANPYTGPHTSRRLATLAELCRRA